MAEDYFYFVSCKYRDQGVEEYKEVRFSEIAKAGTFYAIAIKISMGRDWRELNKRKPLEVDEELLAQVEEFLNIPDPNPRIEFGSKGASTSI